VLLPVIEDVLGSEMVLDSVRPDGVIVWLCEGACVAVAGTEPVEVAPLLVGAVLEDFTDSVIMREAVATCDAVEVASKELVAVAHNGYLACPDAQR
jgi:hypothetical protein